MSSLIFYTDENQALIATDTLATSNKIPGAPFKFTTKAFVIPHLRMIIAGTGRRKGDALQFKFPHLISGDWEYGDAKGVPKVSSKSFLRKKLGGRVMGAPRWS